jgi:hypothetical protein
MDEINRLNHNNRAGKYFNIRILTATVLKVVFQNVESWNSRQNTSLNTGEHGSKCDDSQSGK